MIVFDLTCETGGHVFEAWFGSSQDYSEQQARGLVQCPLCSCSQISKAPMAPAVATTSSTKDAVDPKAVVEALAAVQTRMLTGSSWVGDRFAEEARAMHLGEREAKPVHGRTSLVEARTLMEEGIPIAPLPLPIVPPEEAN